jgi:signal transduction histidine kinase
VRAWRTLTLVTAVALAGGIGSLTVGAAMGMHASELAHLGALILPAVLVTVASIALARPILARASMNQSMTAVAIVGAVAGVANLTVLSRMMIVEDHDATTVAVLFLYSAGAGVGAAIALARSRSRSFDRLASTARALGEGDLDARVGPIDAGPELQALGRALDEMAGRLQSANERAREAEATRRDLIIAVSHDLRTPLASLRAMVEAIDDGVVEDPRTMHRYAGEMRRSVGQLVAMVEDLFELTQLDAGAILVESERARIDDVVHAAIAAVEHEAQAKGLTLVAELDGAGDTPCSPRLVRVLQNLLGNAIRHTPSQGSVRLEATRSSDAIELAVQDTGEGIAPEDLRHIFEPFFRADPARQGPGAGLGLAVAKRIVEALGGRIEAESEPARGSRFAVRVPSAVPSDR